MSPSVSVYLYLYLHTHVHTFICANSDHVPLQGETFSWRKAHILNTTALPGSATLSPPRSPHQPPFTQLALSLSALGHSGLLDLLECSILLPASRPFRADYSGLLCLPG